MKFIGINSKDRKRSMIDAQSLHVAELSLGLVHVDHGVLWRGEKYGLGYVLYEFAFFVPPAEQTYAAIARPRAAGALIGGNAVVYAFNVAGETIPAVPEMLPEDRIVWLATKGDVELAIARGLVARPQLAVNGVVHWRWPETPPADMAAAMRRRA